VLAAANEIFNVVDETMSRDRRWHRSSI